MSPFRQHIRSRRRNQWAIVRMRNHREAGSFTPSIAATVNAAYAENPKRSAARFIVADNANASPP